MCIRDRVYGDEQRAQLLFDRFRRCTQRYCAPVPYTHLRHTAGGDRDGMATEQGYYALAAYYRFVNAQTRLYDMTDVAIQTGGSNTPATGDTGVLVWVIALPVAALAAAFVLKRKEREA